MTSAGEAAASEGHAELAFEVLKAVMVRDMAAATRLFIEEADTLGAEVMRQWQAAAATVREHEARWPALQGLLVGIAGAHQQLQAATADITASAVSAAVQAATREFGQAADAAAVVAAAGAATATAIAGVTQPQLAAAATAAEVPTGGAAKTVTAEQPVASSAQHTQPSIMLSRVPSWCDMMMVADDESAARPKKRALLP